VGYPKDQFGSNPFLDLHLRSRFRFDELVIKVADDTKIFGKVNTAFDGLNLQKDLQELIKWSVDWQMEFNVKKCKAMHFGKKNIDYEYSMNGVVLESVESDKNFGVISHHLKTCSQCVRAYANANKIPGMINRTIYNKHSDIMVKLYKSLVRPHVEYSTAAWSPYYVKDKEVIEKIQHRSILK